MTCRPLLSLLCISVLTPACGKSDNDAPAPKTEKVQLLSSLEEAPGTRAVVASVNGVPVYDDCVARQATAHELTRKQALDECVDFELLAQAALAGGYLGRREVQEQGKQELVRAFIEDDYAIHGPGDLPKSLPEALWAKVKRKYNHDELRAIVYCRSTIDKDVPNDAEEVQKALHFFEDIYQRFEDRTDLEKNDLFGECYQHYEAAGVKNLKLYTFQLDQEVGYRFDFRPFVFGDRGKGQLIAPFRTKEGLNLVLITEVRPPASATFDEMEETLRTALYDEPVYEVQRRDLFNEWVAPFLERAKVESYPDRLPEPQGIGALSLSGAAPTKAAP